MSEQLSFDQDYESNRRAFIERLMEAGWTREEAEAESDNIDNETEGDF